MANYFQVFPPLVFSYRLFFFTNRGNFQVRTWVWRKFAAENRVNFQRGDWTGVKWSSQSRNTNFLEFSSASSTRDLGTRLNSMLRPINCLVYLSTRHETKERTRNETRWKLGVLKVSVTLKKRNPEFPGEDRKFSKIFFVPVGVIFLFSLWEKLSRGISLAMLLSCAFSYNYFRGYVSCECQAACSRMLHKRGRVALSWRGLGTRKT